MAIEIGALRKTYASSRATVHAVRDIDLTIGDGEAVGLVGESGCGKTTVGRMVAGLINPTSGSIRLDGVPLKKALESRQGRRRVQMVFQDPAESLNPRMRVGRCLTEPARLLLGHSPARSLDLAREVIVSAGLEERYLAALPPTLSGGQQQRVAIARAVVAGPDLIVLDEPTASLDQVVRGRIISLLQQLRRTSQVGYLLISHDMSVVRRVTDRVAVMYLGRIVESCPTAELFERPAHPYTQALLSAIPVLGARRARDRIVLRGEADTSMNTRQGCWFRDRCPLAFSRCETEDPRPVAVGRDHYVECFAVEENRSR